MNNNTIDQKLQALLDKQEVLELIHAYCNAADRHDNDKMRTLYHEGAIDDHGPFFKGLASEFIDHLPEIQEPMAILHHNVTTVNLKIDEDRGEGEVYVLAFHQIESEEGLLDLLIGGRYFDRYEKREGIWKFTHRAVLADWTHIHRPSLVALDDPLIEGSYIGKPGPDDPSYSFFKTMQRGKR